MTLMPCSVPQLKRFDRKERLFLIGSVLGSQASAWKMAFGTASEDGG